MDIFYDIVTYLLHTTIFEPFGDSLVIKPGSKEVKNYPSS